MRLIDADALINRMYHDAFEIDSDMQKWDSGCWIRYKMFENAINEQPTIEPKQGEWIDSDEDTYCCSNCGTEAPLDAWEYKYRDKIRPDRTKFCPNCGVRMRD